MRNKVFEYFPLKPTEKEDLWENSIFIFDANILLNLYRYSIDASDSLLEAFRTLYPKIWVPHQVALEFARRRCNIVFETRKKYITFDKSILDFLGSAKALSHLKDDDSRISTLRETLNSWLNDFKQANMRDVNINDDNMLNQVLELFDGNTGDPYDTEQYSELCKEADARYGRKIPPGYMDAPKGKSTNPDDNMYGDYIIWKQILDFAKAKEENIIFITNDQKEDWWQILDGQTIGPRVELLREFRTVTGKQFHMYTMNNFFAFYNKKYNLTPNDRIIQEIKQIQQIENSDFTYNTVSLNQINSQILSLEKKIERSQRAVKDLNKKYGNNKKKMPPGIAKQLMNTEENILQNRIKIENLKVDHYLKSNFIDPSTSA